MNRKLLFCALLLLLSNIATYFIVKSAQETTDTVEVATALIESGDFPPPPPYEYPEDPAVKAKLEEWQNWKFGLMMHWGTYSQWGIVESWSICSEDEPWCKRPTNDYNQYVADYENLQTTFNPTAFNPEKWATAAKYAGMKYVVFTTKHHDGFSMFDTQQTNYSITGTATPFHTNPRANITKEIFSAFQQQGFGIGAYFSKADWHHEDYWASDWATPDRNVNYDTAKYPERWQSFKDFTYNQIEELMTGYGPVDILWLDGGWVRPKSTITSDVAVWCKSPYEQDIDMAHIATMARKNQPGLIIVDRTVAGPFENYRTPEQHVPEEPLDHPWETCMTMAGSWSYNENDQYKPTKEIINYLVNIISKGGNYLLNIGPSPKGDFHLTAYERLKEIGDWMQINSEAIYDTQPIKPYGQGNIRFTSKNDTIYAIYLPDKDTNTLPETITLDALQPKEQIQLLGYDGKLVVKNAGGKTTVQIPKELGKNSPFHHAFVLKFTKA